MGRGDDVTYFTANKEKCTRSFEDRTKCFIHSLWPVCCNDKSFSLHAAQAFPSIVSALLIKLAFFCLSPSPRLYLAPSLRSQLFDKPEWFSRVSWATQANLIKMLSSFVLSCGRRTGLWNLLFFSLAVVLAVVSSGSRILYIKKICSYILHGGFF